MRKTVKLGAAAAMAAVLSTFISAGAEAQQVRTFVSGHGTDSGICGVTTPCRHFAYALTQTGPAGEIVALDSAGYGPVTIAQAVTITSPAGVEASITAPNGQDAIAINPTAAANITLRGLSLEGGGVGANGINLTSSLPNGAGTSSVNIIDCVVKNFTGSGISIIPQDNGGGFGATPVMYLLIGDTIVLNNGTTGLHASAGGMYVTGLVYRTTLNGNGIGIDTSTGLGSLVNILLTNSHVDNNNTAGLSLNSLNANLTQTITMRDSTVTASVSGTDIASAGNVYLYNGNTIGHFQNGGSGNTDGTNNISAVTGAALVKLNPQ